MSKVHVRGLEDLTTEDIKSFVSEHCENLELQRVEWIDDSSANLNFINEADALQALVALSNYPPECSSAMSRADLREAKGFLRRPEANLQIRIAFVTDRKQARAHEASRFYLMHPEQDPRERRRRDRGSDLRRRRYDESRRRRRRSEEDVENFDASMYDDDAGALAKRITGRASKRSSGSWESIAPSEGEANGGRRPLDSYRPRPSRDRSASPGSGPRRLRQRTPPPAYQVRDPHPTPRENNGKELFPTKSGIISESNNGSRELFPNKSTAATIKNELFPAKKNSGHRRSDAFDAADETADLFATRLAVAQGRAGTMSKRYINGVLQQSSKGTDASTSASTDGPLPISSAGIIVRGASSQGVSIKGFAEGSTKELFPRKMGNAGKELFAERLQGRGVRRNRAEDMFS